MSHPVDSDVCVCVCVCELVLICIHIPVCVCLQVCVWPFCITFNNSMDTVYINYSDHSWIIISWVHIIWSRHPDRTMKVTRLWLQNSSCSLQLHPGLSCSLKYKVSGTKHNPKHTKQIYYIVHSASSIYGRTCTECIVHGSCFFFLIGS